MIIDRAYSFLFLGSRIICPISLYFILHELRVDVVVGAVLTIASLLFMVFTQIRGKHNARSLVLEGASKTSVFMSSYSYSLSYLLLAFSGVLASLPYEKEVTTYLACLLLLGMIFDFVTMKYMFSKLEQIKWD